MLWRGRCAELSGRLHERAGRPDEAVESFRTALELLGEADPALTERIGAALNRLQGGTD